MVKQLCVFLRGVNVNGVTIKMDGLKKAFAGFGFQDARTVLATGNVIISTDRVHNAALKADIEAGLSAAFHYDAHVFLRTNEELKAVLSAAAQLKVPPDCHLYYLICDDRAVLEELGGVFASLPHMPNEVFAPIVSGAFWVVPAGSTLDSDFGAKVLGAKKYKEKLTSRNINTIEKISRAMTV